MNKMNFVDIGHWELDLVTDTLVWSDEIFRIFEIDSREFGATYDAFRSIVHPDDRAAVRSVYTRSLADKTPYLLRHRLLMPDGRVKYVNERCRTIYGESGIPVRSIGTVQDVTELVHAEQAASEALATLDIIEDGAFIFHGDTLRFSYVNESAVRQTGYTREELLRMTPLDIEPAFDEARFRHVLGPLMSGDRRSIRFTTFYRGKGTDDIPADVRLQCLPTLNNVPRFIAIVRDISEHKRVEGALSETELLFHALFEQAPDPVYIADIHANILDVNQQTCRELGYTREELLRMRLPDIDHEFRTRSDEEAFWQQRPSGEMLTFEVVHHRKDGSSFPAEVHLSTIHVGDQVNLLGFVRNITERKKAEEALRKAHDRLEIRIQERTAELAEANRELYLKILDRNRAVEALIESERKFRAIFEQAAVGVAIIDSKSGAFLAINQKYTDIIGYSQEEMQALDYVKISHPDDLQADLDNMRLLLDGKIRSFTMDRRLYRKDGVPIWVNLTVSPLWSRGDEPSFHIAIVEDITGRKRSEEALREERDRAQRYLDTVEAIIVALDTVGRVTLINRKGCELLGYREEELLGKNWFVVSLRQPEGVETLLARYQDMMAGKLSSSEYQEYAVVTRSRDERLIAWHNKYIYDGQGKITGYLSAGEDITQRKQAENALKQSQSLLRQLAAHQEMIKEEERKRIAREVHDELGQQLLALRMEVARLKDPTDDVRQQYNERVTSALHLIDGTMETVRSIINDLRPAVLDLGLIPAIEWLVEEFERRSGIVCEIVMQDEDINLDDNLATVIFRILQESLTNVNRHAQASRVYIELQISGGWLVLSVADNGVGIPQGIGRKANSFGLIGIKERISMLEGKFTVTSNEGQGTMMTISIPIEPGKSK